ncbi:MAG: hypothetical protein HOP28_06675 [Gemmatimonadales bacterium]|nr:hypothetical protein [Gemmatimonadales bacterium]
MTDRSRTQIDRLGERIKHGQFSDDDLRALDEYRKSFGQAYEYVIELMRTKLVLEPTGRPAKSTSSIIDKLLRETIRLSQMQDIAGCRVIVADTIVQDEMVKRLTAVLSASTVLDRRVKPSHGYRAVHVVVAADDKPIEIQVRTSLQHLWAELSEKLSDAFDASIKYGGGQEEIRSKLMRMSRLVSDVEGTERALEPLHDHPLKAEQDRIKREVSTFLQDMIKQAIDPERTQDAIPD